MDTPAALKIMDRIQSDLNELRAAVTGEDHQREPISKASIGDFKAVGSPASGVTYKWPPNQLDHYETFQRYEDTAGRRFGVGIAEPLEFYGRMRAYAVVHEVSSGGGLNALAVFVAADDYEQSGEMLCLIKGKGPGGRKMFRPGDDLPRGYGGATVVPFTSRVTGPHSRDGLAIVCHRDRPEHMVQHAAIQRLLRS